MKFSFSSAIVSLDENGERHWDLPNYLRECERAEQLGFTTAYKGERRAHGVHSGQHGVVNNAQLISMYGLANTERLSFATGVVLLPLYHPVTVIQDATMIGAMYPGRYRLTVGAGYNQDDFDVYGIGLNERVERMRVGLEAMNAYREGRPYRFADDGPYRGQVPPPDPAMGGTFPEIYVGGWSPAGVRLAALGDGWETGPIGTIHQIAEHAEIYLNECERLGKKGRISLLREACIAPTDEEAREILGPYILDYHRIYYNRGNAYTERHEPWLKDISSADDITMDHIFPDRILSGSPSTWISTIKEWQSIVPFDEIILRLRYFHGPSIDVELDAMQLIHDEVMPAFA